MKPLSNNEEVQSYLEDLESFMPERSKIILSIRKIILQTLPEAIEVIMYGGIVFKSNKLLLWGLFSRKNYITMEFGFGSEIDDQFSVLEGKGKERRHIKISSYDDIKSKKIEYYIKQSCLFL